MILWISSIVLLIGIAMLIISRKDRDSILVPLGVGLTVASIICGFFLVGTSVPIKEDPIIYIEPSSKFFDEKCIVLVLDDKCYYTNVAQKVNRAKDSILKISQIKRFNSYGVEHMPIYNLEVFSKEEWRKISQENFEKTR